jgi:hypothetical protein
MKSVMGRSKNNHSNFVASIRALTCEEAGQTIEDNVLH